MSALGEVDESLREIGHHLRESNQSTLEVRKLEVALVL